MKKIMFILVIIVLFSSCSDFLLHDDFKNGDFFYLKNKGAIMPVWVKGNVQSNVFVILLHGGGDSAIYYTTYDGINKLENDYALVYYDRRMSGVSQGNASPESYNINQHIEDLEKLILLIRYKYNNPVLFLMGHSFGGMFGTAFLVKPGNQAFIKGWINIDGHYNVQETIDQQITWVIDKAEKETKEGRDVNYWNNEIAWYNSIRPLKYNDHNRKFYDRHSSNQDKLNAMFYNSSNKTGISPSWIFSSPLSVSFLFNQQQAMSYNFGQEYWNINLSSKMEDITVPSLFLWGEHDGGVPVAIGKEAILLIGTHESDKELIILNNSAHVPPIEEPDVFYNNSKLFIERYK